jgi:hypothetical protein
MSKSVEIKLTRKSEKLFKDMAKAGFTSLRESFKRIGDSYRKDVKLIFNKKQPRDPSLRWKPLSPAYAERKRKKFGNKPILRATDRLYKSMINRENPENIQNIKRDSAEYGTSVPYAIYHDKIGTPRQKIPLRNFSIPSDITVKGWTRLISADIKGQLKKLGIVSERDL